MNPATPQSPSAMALRPTRAVIGSAGEDTAARWYMEHGYQVVDRNWRSHQGELDLVLRRGATIVFCEVKSRTQTRFGAPFEAVTRTKQLRIRRLAAEWLRTRGRSLPGRSHHDVRFDVASVLGSDLQILEGAF